MNSPISKYFLAAETIGRLLVRDALWAGNQCFWLTQSESTEETTRVAACSHELADGASGTGLFLARLFALNEDRFTGDVVAGTSRLLISALGSSPALTMDDPPSEQSEVAAAVLEMTTIAGLALEREAALGCVARIELPANQQAGSLSAVWNRRSDSDQPGDALCAQMHQFHTACRTGRAGEYEQFSPAGLAVEAIRHWESAPQRFACFADPLLTDAFLLAAELSDDPGWSDAARLIADHVLTRTDQYGQPWRGAVGREYPPFGLAHGLAGIGHFMLRLSSASIPSLLDRVPS